MASLAIPRTSAVPGSLAGLPGVRRRARRRPLGAAWIDPAARRAVAVPALESWALYVAGWVFLLGSGIWLARVWHYVDGDALSRTANATYAWYSRFPHLAAIGFVWPPLPTVSELPFVLFKPMYQDGLAGYFMSAFYSAGTLVVLNLLFAWFGMPRLFRFACLALYQLNPVVLLYSITGMSESPFVLFVVLTIYGFLRWYESMHAAWMALGAFSSALAFYCRWEGAILMIFHAVTVALVAFARTGNPDTMEGVLLSAGSPGVLFGATWMLFNWMFVGDPLYFMHSQYQQGFGTQVLGVFIPEAFHHWGASLRFTLLRLWRLAPALLPALLACVYMLWRKRDAWGVLTVAICLSLPCFNVAVAYMGNQPPWIRYWMYAVPISFALLPLVWLALREITTARIAVALTLFAYCVTWGSTLLTLINPDVAPTERVLVTSLRAGRPLPDWHEPFKSTVEYLQSHPGTVLMDSFLAFPLYLTVAQPDRFVITSDLDFKDTVKNPVGKVRYLIIPKPQELGLSDALNVAWPTMFETGADIATLVGQIRTSTSVSSYEWRLYEVRQE